MNQFFGSTMANTDANITEWISETRRKASVVINTGGQADDVTQLTVLLGGLLCYPSSTTFDFPCTVTRP